MILRSCAIGIGLGLSLRAFNDYILFPYLTKKVKKAKEKIDEINEQYEAKEALMNKNVVATTHSESPVIEEDLPWGEPVINNPTLSTYKKLSDILEEEDYRMETIENPDYISHEYTEEEQEAIRQVEERLAEEEYPEDDEPTENELSGYYIPDEDTYDNNTYEPDDEGPPLNIGAMEVDEDEFENCPYNGEVYYYYGPSDSITDEDYIYIGTSKEDWILELFGQSTFSDLKANAAEGKDNVIFIRNDKAEVAYKIIYVNEEYDK